MELPLYLRESLVDEMDQFLEAFSSNPDAEAVAQYLIELLESYADGAEVDDIVGEFEDENALDGGLSEVLEGEMSSNDEFEYTGEEVVSLLETLCDIEWSDDLSSDDLDEPDVTEDVEEDED
ncbi:MAG: hypothetical protein JXX28_16990 [Deltaproteobacteria bacterium]|nr:hypothetical protein [Deltaproteobacteria bacterium]